MERRGAPPPARVRLNFLPRPRPAPSAALRSAPQSEGRAARSRRSASRPAARQPGALAPRPGSGLTRDSPCQPRSASREDAAAPGMASLALWPLASKEGKGGRVAEQAWGPGRKGPRVPGVQCVRPVPSAECPNFAQLEGGGQTPRFRTDALPEQVGWGVGLWGGAGVAACLGSVSRRSGGGDEARPASAPD